MSVEVENHISVAAAPALLSLKLQVWVVGGKADEAVRFYKDAFGAEIQSYLEDNTGVSVFGDLYQPERYSTFIDVFLSMRELLSDEYEFSDLHCNFSKDDTWEMFLRKAFCIHLEKIEKEWEWIHWRNRFSFRSSMFSIIDQFVIVGECEIYCFHFPHHVYVAGDMQFFNYFFYNRRLRNLVSFKYRLYDGNYIKQKKEEEEEALARYLEEQRKKEEEEALARDFEEQMEKEEEKAFARDFEEQREKEEEEVRGNLALGGPSLSPPPPQHPLPHPIGLSPPLTSSVTASTNPPSPSTTASASPFPHQS